MNLSLVPLLTGLWQLELDDPEEVTPQAESSDGHPGELLCLLATLLAGGDLLGLHPVFSTCSSNDLKS